MSRALAIVGLALTLVGAAVLSLRDLRRGRGMKKPTWEDLEHGLPRREAIIGFPLIALGSALQIASVATS